MSKVNCYKECSAMQSNRLCRLDLPSNRLCRFALQSNRLCRLDLPRTKTTLVLGHIRGPN